MLNNNNSSSTEDQPRMSMKTQFNRLIEQYSQNIVNSSASSNPQYTSLVSTLISSFESLWHEITASGVISSNDEVDDFSTSALELLWTPYVIGDLYQRVQGQQTNNDSSDSKNENSNALQSVSRQEVLERSHDWWNIFLEWMMQIEIIDEETIAKYKTYKPDQRSLRIELSRLCSELHTKWDEWEGKVQYYNARQARMRKLIRSDNNGNNNDDEDEEEIEEVEDSREAGSEEEEVLRQRALARLRWSCFDICHQLQLSTRELDMLSRLSPEQRMSISSTYQAQLLANKQHDVQAKGNLRQTYTILPGGLMTMGTLQNPQPIPAQVAEQNNIITNTYTPQYTPTTTHAFTNTSSESIALANNQRLFRQAVCDSLMVNRNPPTMTLEAFADKEMARMQAHTEMSAQVQREEEEEDRRIGPDGVEERQRQKDSKWADWKDDHPTFGPSSKGNYA